MNCALCARFLAKKNETQKKRVLITYCEGCRPTKRKCAFQKRCQQILRGKLQFCHECAAFPCENIEKLDARYRTHHHMSMIENQKKMRDSSLGGFIKSEEKKWKCKKCGELICCHNGICFNCGIDKLKKKKRMYRWMD